MPYGVPQPYPVPVSVSSPLVGGGYLGPSVVGHGGISTLGLGGISQYRYGGLNSISSLGGFSNLGHGYGGYGGYSSLDSGYGLYGRHGVTSLGHGIGGLSIGSTLGSGYASAYASLASPVVGSSIKVISSPSLTPLHHSGGLYRYGGGYGGGISLGTTKYYTSPLRFTISKHHHW